jgi:hypothetical protein
MSSPDPQRATTLPTLTWESILDEGVASASATTPPADPPAGLVSINLNLDEAPTAGQTAAPAATRPDGAPPPPPPAPAPSVAARVSTTPEPAANPIGQADDFEMDAAVQVMPAAEFRLEVVPQTIDVSSDAQPESFDAVAYAADTTADPAIDADLPPIQQATPVPPYVPGETPVTDGSTEGSTDVTTGVPLPVADVRADVAAARDVSGPSPALAPESAPLLPGTQPAAIGLPPTLQPDQSAGRAAALVSPLAVEVPKRARPTKRRVRRSLRLLVVLVTLAGITGAAVVYGRPYLFPDGWEPNAKPAAMAVEDIVGAEFVEPVAVTAEPSAIFTTRATDQLLAGWKPQLATWRALGLASGDPTDEVLASLLDGWEPALYSTTDGQIYHDQSVVGSKLDAELTQAMATALLDQRYGWAIGQNRRTLDDAALVGAEVLAQSRGTQRATEFNTELEPGLTAPLAYLPAVLSYEVLAPAMYAELLAPVGSGEPNPLAVLDGVGVGPLPSETLANASAPALVDGDVISSEATSMDRSFWYLVLAGYLDAPTAYTASEAIVESSLTVVQRSGTTCAYATFSGGDLIQTATLRTALESWAGAVPAAFTSAFSVLADGGLQVVSCDPGAQEPGSARIGVARELVGWRSAEIATIVGVENAGAGEAEIALALERLAATDVAARLAASSLELSPSESADAARTAVVTVVTPPPPPAVVEVAD